MNNHIHAKSFVYTSKAHYCSLKIPLLFYARVMKLIALFLFILSMSAAADVVAQKIDLQAENASMKSVLMELTKKTGYTFLFKENEIAKADPVSINLKQKDISEILIQLFSDQPFTYDIKGKIVSIKPKIPVKEIALPQSTIRGRVTDSVGNGLEGVVVELEGTSLRTATDKQGYYVLNEVLIGGNIVFRLIGYETAKMVANRPEINIVLYQVLNELSEVVVSKGYYTTTREFNTGSVSSVKADVLERQPVGDPLLSLSGRIPGLYIQQTSGIPGSAPNFSLRGRNSIANGNNPLFVVDGVPYFSEYPSGAPLLGAGGRISPFANIPIHSIESIDVLKDADATAIYGSRGANGVILITTKKSQEETTTVTLDFNGGAGAIARKLDFLNTSEYLSVRKKAFQNDELEYGMIDYDVNGTWDETRYTDWQKEMIGGTARLTNTNIGIRGGTTRTQFLLSGSYRNETTVFPGDNHNRQYGTHVSINHRSQDNKFKISYAALLSNMNLLVPTTDYTSYIILAPNAPNLYNSDGSLNWENSTWINPFRFLNHTLTSSTNNLNNDLTLSYSIFEGLSISSRFGFNDSGLKTRRIERSRGSNPANPILPSNRRHSLGEQITQSWNIEPMLQYDRVFENSTLNILIGTTFQETTREEIGISSSGYSSDAQIEDISAATTMRVSNNGSSQYRYSAIYSRIGYNYQSKYVLNLTGRRDGSSRFGPGKQFGNFWSLGGVWLFTKESFFPENSFVHFGKLRASYGVTGNDQLGDYKYISAFSASGKSYQGLAGISPIQHTNPDYGWETVNKLETAIELGLFKNRVQLTLNWYRNRTANQLVGYPLPLYTGFGSVQANLPAIVENTGTELELQAGLLNNQNFDWTVDLNLSVPRNKLVSYPDIESSSYANRYKIGQPLTGNFLYHFTGLDKESQLPAFLDLNADGLYRSADDRIYTFIGQKAYAGLNNSFTILKSIQFDFFLQYVNQVAYEYYGLFHPGSFLNSGNNLPRYILDESSLFKHFTTTFSSPAGGAYDLLSQSNGIVGTGSFLRLKNVSIAWTMPQRLTKLLSLKGIKIYAQGQNLFTITDYKGLDPETGRSAGTTGISLPVLRMSTIGVQITL